MPRPEQVTNVWQDSLRKRFAAQALQFSRGAAIVRVQKGKATITDGPFVETKEQVGGFILIEARDRHQAIQLASQIPVARFGAIEVREIKELVKKGTQHSAKGNINTKRRTRITRIERI